MFSLILSSAVRYSSPFSDRSAAIDLRARPAELKDWVTWCVLRSIRCSRSSASSSLTAVSRRSCNSFSSRIPSLIEITERLISSTLSTYAGDTFVKAAARASESSSSARWLQYHSRRIYGRCTENEYGSMRVRWRSATHEFRSLMMTDPAAACHRRRHGYQVVPLQREKLLQLGL